MTRVTGDWLTRTETQTVLGLLNDAGHEAYLVGGCVRNALLGAPVDDIDISTDARPERVTELAEAAGLRAVPTGIDHGTITVVAGGIPHEITTYRADVETDGRHAVVRFSGDIQEDAERRDFTMNALYADKTGAVRDPVGGLPDLERRHVRFINDAAQRIREDYLRILRFFRFSAWYGDPDIGFDPEALAAIADTLDGIDSLSRERVGREITKLLRAADPAPAVAAMHHVGALQRCVPAADPKALGPLVHLEETMGIAPDALRRMAAIGAFDGASLRLSKADQRQLDLYQSLIGDMSGPAEIGYRHGYDTAVDVVLLRAALFEQPVDPEALTSARRGAEATFPLTARDLMPEFTGPALGARLRALEDHWIATRFAASREELLRLP